MALAVMKLANAGTDLQVAKALSRPYVGPFPDFPRPSAGECRDVKVALEALHGPIQRLNDSHIDSSFKPVEAPQVLKLEVEAKQHLNSRSGDIKEQSRGGLGMLTQGNPEEGGSKRIKEESKDALQSELLADHQEGGLRTPEVKSSKRSKFSPSLAYVGAGSAEVKVEDGECDLKSGPSPGFLADEARPSAAGGSGVRKAKEQPMDYEAGFTGAAGIPTSAPNNDQTPQRLLRSQTKAIKKGIVKKESSPNPSSEVDQQKPSRSRGKPAGSRKRSFQESQQEPLLIVAPVTPQSQGVIGRGTKSHPSGQFDLSLSETTSPHSPQASGLPLTLTSAPLQIPPVPLGGSADQSSVLDSLVRTILSQNTTDTNSKRAFASLKLAFPTWEDVRAAGPGPLAASIKSGGLAEVSREFSVCAWVKFRVCKVIA